MKVTFILFLLLVALPIAELTVLIQVGSAIGVLPTIALLIAISLFGAIMLRQQSFAAVMRANAAMQAGSLPKGAIADGVGLFVAAVLIMTPGLITSAIGAVLLVPPVRRAVIGWALGRMVAQHVTVGGRGGPFTGRRRGPGAGSHPGPHNGPGHRPDIIEGDYEPVDDAPDNGPQRAGSPLPSPWRRTP